MPLQACPNSCKASLVFAAQSRGSQAAQPCLQLLKLDGTVQIREPTACSSYETHLIVICWRVQHMRTLAQDKTASDLHPACLLAQVVQTRCTAMHTRIMHQPLIQFIRPEDGSMRAERHLGQIQNAAVLMSDPVGLLGVAKVPFEPLNLASCIAMSTAGCRAWIFDAAGLAIYGC